MKMIGATRNSASDTIAGDNNATALAVCGATNCLPCLPYCRPAPYAAALVPAVPPSALRSNLSALDAARKAGIIGPNWYLPGYIAKK
jgi:hypothetical protein